MTRLLLIAALAMTASIAAAAPAGASCVAAVRWHGTLYLQAPSTVQSPPGAAVVRGGVIPGCNDTVVATPGAAQPIDPDRAVTVRRLRGIPAAVAVRSAGVLYVTPACGDELAARPQLTELPRRCGL